MSYDLSISEENREVVEIIADLRKQRLNVSDYLCKYIIEAHERQRLEFAFKEHEKQQRAKQKELDSFQLKLKSNE